MVSESNYMALAILILRILTLLTLIASILVLVGANFELSDGWETSFNSVFAYMYTNNLLLEK